MHDPNLIWSIPIKNRTSDHIKKGHEHIIADLSEVGFKPSVHYMDSEASQELKEAFTQANTKCQLVPAHQHRTNTADGKTTSSPVCVPLIHTSLVIHTTDSPSKPTQHSTHFEAHASTPN